MGWGNKNKPSPFVYTEPWRTMPSVCLCYWDGTELTHWVGLPCGWVPDPNGLKYSDPVKFGPVATGGREINPGDLFIKVDWYGRSTHRIQVMVGATILDGDHFTLEELHFGIPELRVDQGHAMNRKPAIDQGYTSDQVIVDLPDLN